MEWGMRYVQWTREGGKWVGVANGNCGPRVVFHVERGKRGGKAVVYLRRIHGSNPDKCSTETCSTIAHAKEYANELARLARFQPIGKTST
jgi:hypothetical protein